MKVWKSDVVLCLLCCMWCEREVYGQNFNPIPRNEQPSTSTSTALPSDFSIDAVVNAFQLADEQRTVSAVLPRRPGQVPNQTTPSPSQWTEPATFRHNLFLQSGPRARQMEEAQSRYEGATKILQYRYTLTSEQIKQGLEPMNISSILADNSTQSCTKLFLFTNCSADSPYRTFDGTCNNIRNPSWGMAACCFERFMDPVYADGISALRISVTGRALPTPRRISLEIHSHIDNPAVGLSHMFMQWGQFLDHDFSLTPIEQEADNVRLSCCPVSENNSLQCAPLLFERDDPFFSQLGINCIHNARSVVCSTCHLGARQQTNQLTAFIDGSMVYGTSTDQANGLRDRNGRGTLRATHRGNLELLPLSSIPANDGCSFQSQTESCFEGGDFRVNQHVALTSFHTIFLRHHNRIANRLRELNRNWDDERLFQESRRILGAQLQIITYAEFLPLVLGEQRMQWFDLYIQREPIYTQYDPTVKPTLMNEFSTAAFRFGHSMVNSFFPEISDEINSGNRLRDLFLWPFNLYRSGHMEDVLRGMTHSFSQSYDRHVIRDLTNHLYQRRGNASGLDLASLNVMRGRDHGIPPYVKVVRFCGGPTITKFRQLDSLFTPGYRKIFQSIYESVEDIDLFSGGLAERPNRGAIIGPTFTCIIGVQFYHLKYGDRFYFEHGGEAGSFTLRQIQELKKTSFAKIICENSEIRQIQPNVMLNPNTRNPIRPCEMFDDVDLSLWRE